MSIPRVCHTCREPIAGYESVQYGSPETGYRDLRNRCFNEEVARLGGLNFEHIQFEPVEMMDAAGEPHRFHFCLRLHGEHVALEAFELKGAAPGGYTFEILGDPEGDLFGPHGAAHRAHAPHPGRIDWDENEDGHVPLLVIDGREVTWEEFGQMLMSYEGWQFKLEIKDPSDEV